MQSSHHDVCFCFLENIHFYTLLLPNIELLVRFVNLYFFQCSKIPYNRTTSSKLGNFRYCSKPVKKLCYSLIVSFEVSDP